MKSSVCFLIVVVLFSCSDGDPTRNSLPVYISLPLEFNKEDSANNRFMVNEITSAFKEDCNIDDLEDRTGLKWMNPVTNDSVINLNQYFPGESNKFVYIVERFQSDGAENRILSVGCDDGITVWVNGDSVFFRKRNPELRKDSDFIQAYFRGGTNIIIYKIHQLSGNWGVYRKLLSDIELDRYFTENYSQLYSNYIMTSIIPDSASMLQLRYDSRRRFDTAHSVFLNWSTFEGRRIAAVKVNPPEIGTSLTLPVHSETNLLCEVKILSVSGGNLYQEMYPIFRESMLTALITRYSTIKTSDPIAIAKIQGLKKVFSSHPKRPYSTRLKASLLYDCYRYFDNNLHPSEYTGAQILGYMSDIDSTIQPYRVFIPANYNCNMKYPATLLTHGLVDKEQDFWSSQEGGSHYYFSSRNQYCNESNRILVMSHGRGNQNYLGDAIEEFPKIIDQVEKFWNIDRTNISLIGYSRGARNLLQLMGVDRLPISTIVLIGPLIHENEMQLYRLLLRIKGRYPRLKWYIRHGLDDSISPIHLSRQLVEMLNKLNFNVDYKEIPHSNHFSQFIDQEREFYIGNDSLR
jgi:predicted esterase